MNTVIWNKKSLKQLKKIPTPYRVVIMDATRKLEAFPKCPNVRPLENHKYGYRLRVGRYRVLFDFDGQVKIVEIQEVRKRDERTY